MSVDLNHGEGFSAVWGWAQSRMLLIASTWPMGCLVIVPRAKDNGVGVLLGRGT